MSRQEGWNGTVIQAPFVEMERTLVAARWLVLTAVLVLAHFAQGAQANLPALYALTAAGAAYNFAYLALLRRRYLPPALTESTIFFEFMFLGAAVLLTGGRESPGIPLLIWPVVGAAFRLGLTEALVAATLGSLVAAYVFVGGTWESDLTQAMPVAIAAAYLFSGAFLMNTLFITAAGPGEGGVAVEREAQTRLVAARTQAQALAAVSSVLSGTLNYQRVLETILSELHQLVTFDVGIVFLFDSGSNSLRVAAGQGLTAPERQLRVDSASGGIGRVVQQGDPVAVNDPARDEELQRFGSLADAQSGMCVPLHAGFEMYGAVLVASKTRDAFSPTHQDLMLAFCNQAALAMHNAQLQESLRKERDRVIESDEEVRRRMAMDLHDGPVQLVAAMAMKSEVIKRMATVDPPRLAEELDALAEMSHRASRDLRTVLFELRPVMLESHGLVATLKEYVQKMRDAHGAPLRLEAAAYIRRLPTKTESTIFAIVQEAVNNAVKHAEARNVWIRLAERDRSLVVVVEDDGRGFELATVQGTYGRRGSLGLLNMHERAEMIDGALDLRSQPGTGTTLTLRVPLSETPTNAEADGAGIFR